MKAFEYEEPKLRVVDSIPTTPRKSVRDRIRPWDELLSSPPAIRLVGDLLYRDTLAFFTSPYASFKSYLAIGWACALAAGQDWGAHRIPKRGRVLYIAAEGGTGLAWRMEAWAQFHGVPWPELAEWVTPIDEPVQLGNDDDVDELVELAREQQFDLVVVDTLARSIDGLEENSATDMGRAVEAAERIRRACQGTVLLVHHTGKNGEYRGSSAIPSAAWTELSGKREDMAVNVRIAKHKEARDQQTYGFDLVACPVHKDEAMLSRMRTEWGHGAFDEEFEYLVAVPRLEPVATRDKNPHTGRTAEDDADELATWDPPPKSGNDVHQRSANRDGTKWGKTRASKAYALWKERDA